ncbi:cytidine deaminase [[Candida] jaroonii]|uniref:Cytidine deaminase n=1 Tax=[Candida] jaroonii TaxID=467808 RepID=A0ACA9YCY2_9ASCO|nr:cytidine deaminase [[Candida] jaroonii]
MIGGEKGFHLVKFGPDLDQIWTKLGLFEPARDLAYCPYSKFRVGCTILTEDGEFISGANVENASYGAGICAERTTIVTASNQGKRKFKLIAISGDTDEPLAPCGVCRQVIREFSKDIPIVMLNKTGEKVRVKMLSEMLPFSFGPEDLGVSM